MEKVAQWFDELAKTDTIRETVEGFNLSEYIGSSEDVGKLLETVDSKLAGIDVQKIPHILDALYVTQNKDKFHLFCYLLEKTHTDLPFLTSLENYPIHREKYRALLPTILRVVGELNGIDDCMWLLFLKGVYDKELFDEAIVKSVREVVERDLTVVCNYIKKSNYDVSDTAANTAGILLDVAGHFATDGTLACAEDMLMTKNNSVKLFAAINLLTNQKDVDEAVFEEIASELGMAHRLLRLLERNGCADKYPSKYADQEWIAKSDLAFWLAYPTELGKNPDEMEKMGVISRDGYDYYVFKFRSDTEKFKDKGWMIGLSGGYEVGKFTEATSGYTFSKFDTLTDDFERQGNEIIELISEHWKQRAKQS